jgi:predicted Zn-dependent protease
MNLKILFWLLLPVQFIIAQGSIFDEIAGTINDLTKISLNILDISDTEENDIGTALAAELESEMKTGTTKKWDVKKIFNKVVKTVSRKNIKYSYKIVADDEVNAFAIAGGRVYINTGLLNFVKSEEELAFVIAHELAHIDKKHCINKIKLTYIAGRVNVTLAMLVDAMKSVYDIPFNKYDEFEADDFGVKMMQKAGYNKKGGIDFFKRLAVHFDESERDPINDFVASHPLSLERAKRIEKMK